MIIKAVTLGIGAVLLVACAADMDRAEPAADSSAQAADTIVLPYNNLEAVQEAFHSHPGEIACVITEASPGNGLRRSRS